MVANWEEREKYKYLQFLQYLSCYITFANKVFKTYKALKVNNKNKCTGLKSTFVWITISSSFIQEWPSKCVLSTKLSDNMIYIESFNIGDKIHYFNEINASWTILLYQSDLQREGWSSILNFILEVCCNLKYQNQVKEA